MPRSLLSSLPFTYTCSGLRSRFQNMLLYCFQTTSALPELILASEALSHAARIASLTPYVCALPAQTAPCYLSTKRHKSAHHSVPLPVLSSSRSDSVSLSDQDSYPHDQRAHSLPRKDAIDVASSASFFRSPLLSVLQTLFPFFVSDNFSSASLLLLPLSASAM